jgi:glucokinase
MPDVTEPIPLARAAPPFFLGFDVGGTSIKIGIVDDTGHTVARCSLPTMQAQGPENACQRMQQRAAELAEEVSIELKQVMGVGLATPGTMDIKAGMLLQPHNLRAWWDFPIRDHLRDVIGKQVAFANDASAAAYGEYWVGSGADFQSMVLFTLGTGIGGGIIQDGKSLDGEHSHGSECGHTYIQSGPTARMCGCGQAGHLEAYSSGKAVVQRTLEALESGRESSIGKRIAAGETLTPLIVSQEAEKDDNLALEIVMDTADYLSLGAVNMMHTIDPEAVIFGGAMNFGGADSDLGRRFLERIRHHIQQRAFPALAKVIHVDFAELGGHAGYIGAAAVGRAMHYEGQA